MNAEEKDNVYLLLTIIVGCCVLVYLDLSGVM